MRHTIDKLARPKTFGHGIMLRGSGAFKELPFALPVSAVKALRQPTATTTPPIARADEV